MESTMGRSVRVSVCVQSVHHHHHRRPSSSSVFSAQARLVCSDRFLAARAESALLRLCRARGGIASLLHRQRKIHEKPKSGAEPWRERRHRPPLFPFTGFCN